jgi:hypothetical protein
VDIATASGAASFLEEATAQKGHLLVRRACTDTTNGQRLTRTGTLPITLSYCKETSGPPSNASTRPPSSHSSLTNATPVCLLAFSLLSTRSLPSTNSSRSRTIPYTTPLPRKSACLSSGWAYMSFLRQPSLSHYIPWSSMAYFRTKPPCPRAGRA